LNAPKKVDETLQRLAIGKSVSLGNTNSNLNNSFTQVAQLTNDQLKEVVLITADCLPLSVAGEVKFGGIVTARSVQVLSLQGRQDGSERERNYWWDEVRQEIQKSTQALGCTHVIGYRETVCIY
jgi:hypothetical protein